MHLDFTQRNDDLPPQQRAAWDGDPQDDHVIHQEATTRLHLAPTTHAPHLIHRTKKPPPRHRQLL